MKPIYIIGGGFTGLTAAYILAHKNYPVVVFEADDELGGLAGSFRINGQRIEKFYHHWFTNDTGIIDLVKELGLENLVTASESNTGMYFANNFFRLSTPMDLLKFTPLSLRDRFRLGFNSIRLRTVKNWRELEHFSAEEWLIDIFGQQVFEVIFQPLLKGKFGEHWQDVSAVWIWNKLKLRGSSRDKSGSEKLAYIDGGFQIIVDRLSNCIESLGGKIVTNAKVEKIFEDDRGIRLVVNGEEHVGSACINTVPPPLLARLVQNRPEYSASLEQIKYIGNTCLVLDLKRSLSETYWLNVNDPEFPFVGLIEHTNFHHQKNYGGSHIAYLSKYLPTNTELYRMDTSALLKFSIPYLQRLFPEFSEDWINNCNLWKAPFSQPIIIKNYSDIIPDYETPVKNLYSATMAQIYPQDRGTNYAVIEGKKIAEMVHTALLLRQSSAA